MQLSVTTLSLVNFRSYARADFNLAPQTVIVGPNAAGKTNILEALYLLASTKSFRADRESEMIRWGETGGRVAAEVTTDRPRQVVAQLAAGARVKKSFTVDKVKKPTREIARNFPMVLFSADDVRLIDGAPGRRRRALDLILSQSSASYHQALNRYGRVLASRNRLLEQVQTGEATSGELDFWDTELAEAGQRLIDDRLRLTEFLNGRLGGLYGTLATGRPTAGAGLRFLYQPLAEELASEIGRRRQQDIAVGTTTAGPHRDDWQLLLGNRPLGSFGSGGEYRSAMLALRMAEIEWLGTTLEITPVLLLDDVFSELDQHRREALLAHLPEAQTIITTPEVTVVPDQFGQAEVIKIKPKSGVQADR